jgi:adenylate cyclase
LRDPNRIVCRLRYEADRPEDDCIFVVEDRAVTLGRASECDLVLNHESVSRAHARFSRETDGWRVEDLGSKNGIRVNTFRVEQERIRDGDRIDLGSARLYVEIGPAGQPADPANVVFSERDEPSMHTEVLELSELSSLLSRSGSEAAHGARASRPGGEVSELSEGLARVGRTSSGEDAGELLRTVGEAAEALITCDSLDETLERILGLVFAHLPAERGVICLYDEASRRTEPKATRTLEGISDAPIHISSNIVRHVLDKKQALLVRDTQMDERFGSAESVIMMQIRSVMCAPLYRNGRAAGFIYTDRQTGNAPFDLPDLHLLSALAMLSAVAIETARLRDSIRHEQELRARLARYSSPAVVEQILRASEPAERGMAADERDVTVLFADLKGFTEMAESMRSAEVIRILNRVFERLTEVVFDLEGTLDKFRGDGMMAFFGAPLAMPDHAERAVEAALRMQEALAELNARHRSLRDLRMRIGINSGPVVVGDIGSPQRKDYTVIGDVVNTASRLESFVAQPGEVVIGRSTWDRACDHFVCEPLDEVRLKGKQQSVHPYRVIARRER